MFWTDWGKRPTIERADMDGGNRRNIATTKLGWPNGLAVDGDTVFWGDARTEVGHRSRTAQNFHEFGFKKNPLGTDTIDAA